MKRCGTFGRIALAATCALLLADRAHSAGVPLGGFIPFVGIGLTKEFETFDTDPDGTFFIADASYSWGNPPLGPGSSAYFDIALLDTGAATHILTQVAAGGTGFSIQAEGLRGTLFQKIFGATGPLDLRINDALGIYAAGLQHRTGAGAALTMDTTPNGRLRGQTSIALLEGAADWTLPNILGLPMAAQHAIVIRNSEPLVFQHQNRTMRTPRVDFVDLGTGAQQGIARRTNLRLRPSDSFLTGPLYGPSNEIGPNFELNFHDNPTAPTVVNSGGLYVDVDVTNDGYTLLDQEILFDTGADLTVFSEVFAASLGLDVVLDQPDFVLEVEGASGILGGIPGFYVDELKIDAVGGAFIAHNVPVAVLDVPNPIDAANVIDAILGMHLFTGRDLVIDAIPAATGGGSSPRLYISDPVTETHNWSSTAASATWATSANWTAAGTPDELWAANVANVSGSNQSAVVAANSQVFQMTISGTPTASMTVQINTGVTLTTFGETQIGVGGRLELPAGAKLDTQFVNIDGGTLAGSGNIFAGTGPIHGAVRNLSGRIEPGAPVGTLTIDGDLSQQAGGTLAIDLGGTSAGQYDQVDVGRIAFLDGTLEVSRANLGGGLFAPSVGNTFTILTAGERVSGTFDYLLLPDGFLWNVAYNEKNVVLSVTGLGVGGDFNLDGRVDTADYIVWRNGPALQSDYNLWRVNFGKTLLPGASAGLPVSNVPEPVGSILLIVGALWCVTTRVRRAKLLL